MMTLKARTTRSSPARPGDTALDTSPGLVMVSFRGDRAVIDELKVIAKRKGRPYQAVLRHALKDYVDSELARGPKK